MKSKGSPTFRFSVARASLPSFFICLFVYVCFRGSPFHQVVTAALYLQLKVKAKMVKEKYK